MKKLLKYGIITAAVGLLGYNSIYIKKLSEVKATAVKNFDAAAYIATLWKQKLPARIATATDMNTFRNAVDSNPDAAFQQYSNALAIGNYRYALVKGTANVDQVKEDDVMVTINADKPFKGSMVTEFIYGNAVRDASGLIVLKDFPNTNDLNGISEALNKSIRDNVVPAFRKSVQQGQKISFVAAVELNKEHIRFEDLELIPLSVKINP